ncbi:class I SAM-dependent methyltransferase [Paenibacillus senegalensis]|uniref:class I SAM-dependent methyltransferase n=1 Tax=Paenibacillus senegalensis TaxID=1465766 RepID=UPI000289AFEF|nr:class I SAM-dependent methyltransferase [Paenibacillus senegalensis]
MPSHEQIYQQESHTYEELISKQQSLLEVIESIRPIKDLEILDLGAGSGRLTRVLAPQAKSIIATDSSEAMLKLLSKFLDEQGWGHVNVQVADHRSLPVKDSSVDLIVSGWSIAYLCNTDVKDWRLNLRQVMSEIKRVLRPGGTVILFENYGTGSEEPDPPKFLQPYFKLLEQEYGFTRQWIRTDYVFADVEEAERLIRFFFGDQLGDQVVQEQKARFPECAGVWSLQV